MSLLISTRSELLKTKRTYSFWFTIIGAFFIPLMLSIGISSGDDSAQAAMTNDPWTEYLGMGWQLACIFLLPIYTILVSALLINIEHRNNTWKQVFASPQSMGNIFFSKLLTIQVMILFCFLLLNVFMIMIAVIANLANPKFNFLHQPINWQLILYMNFKAWIATLGISAIQYWLSLRFKNFIAPLGIGLALFIVAVVVIINKWEHVYKYPYALPALSFDAVFKMKHRPFLENHEWNSIGYFVFFILVGFWDMKTRKEKG
jgi:lantibiotic transport system permease protein